MEKIAKVFLSFTLILTVLASNMAEGARSVAISPTLPPPSDPFCVRIPCCPKPPGFPNLPNWPPGCFPVTIPQPCFLKPPWLKDYPDFPPGCIPLFGPAPGAGAMPPPPATPPPRVGGTPPPP